MVETSTTVDGPSASVDDLPDSNQGHSDILTFVENGVGRVVLNRPSALNALTLGMVSDIKRSLGQWNDENLSAVVLTSTSRKAFCAGGDIRQIRSNTIGGNHSSTRDFFSTEYSLNAEIARYQTPTVSVINGICMGGGLGLAVHGKFRVVTEKALFAMPENIIGFFPDVGSSYFLSRLPGALGMYIGLTGARLTSLDAIYAGLATHYIDSATADLVPGLLATDPHLTIDEKLRSVAPPSVPGEGSLETNRAAIDHCFGAPSIGGIFHRLRNLDSEWSRETMNLLTAASPQSLLVTYALISRGYQRSLDQCLSAELDVALAISRSEDFIEGVRSALVDKDNSPAWGHPQFSGFDSDGYSSWSFN